MRRQSIFALALLILGSAPLTGCAYHGHGTTSSWELFKSEKRSSWQRLRDSAALLEGHNDFSDLAVTGRQITKGPSGSFHVIARDLRETFAPPFNFQELRDTLRILE